MMRVHKAGIGIINFATAVLIIASILSWFLFESPFLKYGISLSFLIIYFLIIQFFRYPARQININEKFILSPADGKICDIKEAVENEYLNTKCIQVSIFMSPTNVHINWIPIPGMITYLKHKNGEFYAAFKDKSADENERTTSAIRIKDGREIVVRQIAGAMARRIINFVGVGQQVDQTDELGFIRFGSRVDLFLPLNTRLLVKLKDKVTGSQTIIGEIIE